MQQGSATATCKLELAADISRVNSRLLQELHNYPNQTEQLMEAAEYAVNSPGHRWRPILFSRIYEKLSDKEQSSKALPVACAIEFLHSASLILDDLPSADDATLRRGKQPCHLRFGEARAVLTALWLCDVAQHLIHEFEEPKSKVARVDLEELFRETKNQMMKGQILDLEEKNSKEDLVIEKYRLKSGALYAFTASAPAHLLRLPELARHLTAFGNNLGIAYQCSDDIFDQTGSAEDLGKDVRKDANKSTIPALLGLRKAAELRDYYKQRAINDLSNIPAPIDDVIEFVEQICL
jgi:geranylgeranyl pyrophosphate synthase